ncbi:MAG: class II aldolase/adducin family protein [Clostridia bacterium]|nr:class II aldolase/adducin family protein [Clostridia bacterium]
MAYTENEARALVVEAGNKLVEKGLIARTWGNVSARISDSKFVITPSGRAYETLTPADMVVVNIKDCSHEGDAKPSSEKGIHADAYKLHPEVNFVIHTHQVNASVYGAAGKPLDSIPEEYRELLGDYVPVADYGMPSTDTLRNAVRTAYSENLGSKAVLMKHHGTVCLGESFDEAFEVASELEKVCQIKLQKMYQLYEGTKDYSYKDYLNNYIKHNGGGNLPKSVPDLGSSFRCGDEFYITFRNGSVFSVNINSGKCDTSEKLPFAVKIHRMIYKTSKVNHIRHLVNSSIIAYGMSGKSIKPRLDDFAQIAGVEIPNMKWDGSSESAGAIARAFTGKNLVLIRGVGAICTGSSASDLDAVELVADKECRTQIGALYLDAGESLSPVDCGVMRAIYVLKYSKKANK